MGFQTGSQIDPRLGKLDYSGYAKAGEIQGEAMSNLGKQIGAGIEKYAKKKEDKANEDGMVDFLMETKAFGDATPEQVRAGVRGAGGGSQLLSVYKMTQDMLNAAALAPGAVDQQQAELNKTVSQTDYYKAQTTAAGQPTPESISTKKLASGQAYLDENNLVIKDGMLYKKKGGYIPGFGGSLTPVPNPEAYFNVEGIPELVAQSSSGSNTVMMQPQGGWSSKLRDAESSANVPTEASVSADALNSAGGIPTANQKPASYNPAMQDAGASIGQGLRNLGKFLSPSDVEKYYTPGQGIR
jgi:hypothetical protein